MLRQESGELEHRHFADLLDYLQPQDCLVINNTRVIPARLFGEREGTQAKIEILLLKRNDFIHSRSIVCLFQSLIFCPERQGIRHRLISCLNLASLIDIKEFTLGMYGEGDFYTMKGVVEEFFERAGLQEKTTYDPEAGKPFLHPGRQANII